jgi:putative polyketide hydroxylase
VLRGTAAPALLDSYDGERRHVAERTLGQALARLSAWFDDPGKRLPPPEPIVDDYAVIFGHLYPAGALIAEGNIPEQGFDDPKHPSGRPGSRAAHLIVERAGVQHAIHDLFDKEFVLVTGANGAPWCDAAASITRKGFNLPCFRIGQGGDLTDVAGRFAHTYGVGPDDAVLVRPDGFIAWRSRNAGTKPEADLRGVLERLNIHTS